MRHDDARAERRPASPSIGDVVHPPADDARTGSVQGFVEDLSVDTGRWEVTFLVTLPGAAEHPVMKDLTLVSQPLIRSVVWSGNEAVKRHRYVDDHTAHVGPPRTGRLSGQTVSGSETHRQQDHHPGPIG